MGEVLAALITGMVALVVLLITYSFNKQAEINKLRLEMKRAALLQALDLTDAILSHRTKHEPTDKTDFTTEEVRKCYNNLAVSINNPALLKKFRIAWGLEPEEFNFGIMAELRNMARLELGFGENGLDTNMSRAFFNHIIGAKETSETMIS